MTFDFDTLLRTESDRFLTAIDSADPDIAVPSCPDWTADDLLWHLGEVQHFWATIVAGRITDPTEFSEPERPAGRDALRAFFVDASAALSGALAAADDSDPAWSWHAPDQTAGFTRRRQVHEALIHRVDAELAAGSPSEIDADLAADGVDEVLSMFFGGAPEWATVAPGPIGTVRCTDVARSWFVEVRRFSGTSPNTGTTYTDEPVLEVVSTGDPTFDISGSAADLDLWLWSRGEVTSVSLDGDTSAIQALVDEGME